MTQKILTIVMLVCLSSMTATAQENVKNAFKKFVSSKKVSVTKTLTQERDFTKDNHPIIAKADVYVFTIKKKDRKLIDEVIAAFEKDRENENVYLMLTHNGGQHVPTNGRELLVGNDRKNSVYIGMKDIESWQLLCLIDPADATRSHRYAYAIEWNDDPKQVLLSGKIRGKLVVTYSPIPKELLDNNAGNGQPSANDGNRNENLTSEEIAKEVYKMGIAGKFNHFENEAQFLIAFDALKTEFYKGNALTNEGISVPMVIYSLCSYLAPMVKDNPDLRDHLIKDLDGMKSRCDMNSDLGKSHIDYFTLAIKALKK